MNKKLGLSSTHTPFGLNNFLHVTDVAKYIIASKTLSGIIGKELFSFNSIDPEHPDFSNYEFEVHMFMLTSEPCHLLLAYMAY